MSGSADDLPGFQARSYLEGDTVHLQYYVILSFYIFLLLVSVTCFFSEC